MISLALAAGYATRMYPLTEQFPKPLLPIAGVTILDRLLLDLDHLDAIDRHVVVSNHKFIAHFQDWLKSTPVKKPVTLIDDGTTDNEHRLGAVVDMQLAIEREGIMDDLFVLAADNLLDFSLKALVDAFAKDGVSRVFCYREPDAEKLRRCGVLTPDESMRVVRMAEKPEYPETSWAVPPFYLYAKRDLPLIKAAIEEGANTDAPGSLVAWMCRRAEIRAMEMPGRRVDVGSLSAYEAIREQGIR